jgi:predicted HTH transcriptional regulator
MKSPSRKAGAFVCCGLTSFSKCRDEDYTEEVSVNLFDDDLTCVKPDDLRTAILALAQAGIEEKYRLDFKETWDAEKRVPDVAAFANTYGGLLIVGVSDDRQRFPGIPGPRNSDLKTQLSSIIASRISPPPLFEVHTCPTSAGSSHFLVAIRIQSPRRLHLYLKGNHPVWVRTEDKSEPATAFQASCIA